MKKIILFLLIITAVLSYLVEGFEFILIAIGILSLIFLVIVTLIRLFKKLNFQYIKIPLLIILICFIGAIVSLARPYGEDAILTSGSVSEKLEYAYKTDQNDRKQLKSFIGFFSDLEHRDELRMRQVKEIQKKNEIEKSIDKFYAAFVYHHSDNSNDYQTASELAAEAAKSNHLKDNYQVQWLKKAAYDRYMVSIGKPEKYNTQNSFSMELE